MSHLLCWSLVVREEEQERVRKEEEENWSKALSGELSGPRAAALGAAESVSANVEGGVPEFLTFEEDKDEDMYTAMFKSECVCVLCVCVCVCRSLPYSREI